jgi:hypothetical protein
MKLPDFTPPNSVDHPGLPEVAYNAMQVLSDQVEQLTIALQKNISPEDNENSETRALALEHNKEYEISLQEIKGRPTEVRVLDQDLFEMPLLSWEVVDADKIKVKVNWLSQPTGAVPVSLLIRGGSDNYA